MGVNCEKKKQIPRVVGSAALLVDVHLGSPYREVGPQVVEPDVPPDLILVGRLQLGLHLLQVFHHLADVHVPSSTTPG